MAYSFVSENTLDYLSLHDCVVESAFIVDEKLVLEFEHIDVLAEHPLNTNSVAKYSGKAALIFENYTIEECILFDTSKVDKSHVVVENDAERVSLNVLELAKEFEVLQVDKIEENSNQFVYEFHGTLSQEYAAEFGFFRIRFDKVYVCWNELIDDSWFVDFGNR